MEEKRVKGEGLSGKGEWDKRGEELNEEVEREKKEKEEVHA